MNIISTKVLKWDANIEKILSDNYKKAIKHSILHEYESLRYNNLNFVSNVSTVIILAITGAFSSNSSNIPGIDQREANLILTGILVVPAIINSLQQAFNYSENTTNHRIFKQNFEKLADSIKCILTQDYSTKQNSLDYFKISSNELDSLISNAPFITQYAYKKFNVNEKNGVFDNLNIIMSDDPNIDNIIQLTNRKSNDDNYNNNELTNISNRDIDKDTISIVMDPVRKTSVPTQDSKNFDYNMLRFYNNMYQDK